jgi:hypothetical protein|tara:strand:+ start:495 stop:674 length:180 start_codon:yes stop_codon:yes gene_type:complete
MTEQDLKRITNPKGPNDLEKIIEELETRVEYVEKDNWRLAKEVDRLNDYVQILEMEKKK